LLDQSPGVRQGLDSLALPQGVHDLGVYAGSLLCLLLMMLAQIGQHSKASQDSNPK
jgi:hypothetical protein